MIQLHPTPAKVSEKLRSRSTRQLIGDFVVSGFVNDPYIPDVRGWIMEELEARNPDAFNAWLDNETEDKALYKYFDC